MDSPRYKVGQEFYVTDIKQQTLWTVHFVSWTVQNNFLVYMSVGKKNWPSEPNNMECEGRFSPKNCPGWGPRSSFRTFIDPIWGLTGPSQS